MKIAIILSAVDKASRVINATVAKVQKGLNKFGNYATVGGAAATLFFANAVKAAEESEVATNRLQQVFKSMGQDYTTATRNAAAYASALQMQIGFEDEAIMAVQAKVATFEKAANATARANGIFNRATAAAFDMQAAGFGDASSNAVQLGKALNDPIKGVNALRRSGITFTDAERKKIAMLVKSNKTFEAQNLVMKAIEKQVGGVAKATVTNSQKMRLAWGEVMERIGAGLLPIVQRFADYMLNKVIPAVTKFVDEHPKLVKWLGIGAAALLAVGTAAKVVAFIFNGTLIKAFKLVGRVLMSHPILLVAGLIIIFWKPIKRFFSWLLNGVLNIFNTVWSAIKAIPIAVWNGMVALWSGVKTFFTGIWNGLVEIVSGIWDAIGNAIIAPIAWIKKAWQSFKNWFSNLFNGPSKMIDDMVEKAAKAQAVANNAANASSKASFYSAAAPSSPAGGFSPFSNIAPIAAGKTTVSFAPVYNVNGGNPGEVQRTIESSNRTMLKQIEEAQRKKDRTKF